MPAIPPRKRVAEPQSGRNPGPQARRRKASSLVALVLLALAGLWLSGQGLQILSVFQRLGLDLKSPTNCDFDVSTRNLGTNVSNDEVRQDSKGSLHFIETRWPAAALSTGDGEIHNTLKTPDIIVKASGFLPQRIRALCVAKAAADAAQTNARVLWADEPNHLPAGQFSDFFLPIPGVAVEAEDGSGANAQPPGWQGHALDLSPARCGPTPLSDRHHSQVTVHYSTEAGKHANMSSVLTSLQHHANACLPIPALQRCYASLSPSPAVRQLLAAEDIQRVVTTLAVYIEAPSAPSLEYSDLACLPSHFLNCTVASLVAIILGHPSLRLSLSALLPSFSSLLSSALHPSRGPYLLRATQERALVCNQWPPGTQFMAGTQADALPVKRGGQCRKEMDEWREERARRRKQGDVGDEGRGLEEGQTETSSTRGKRGRETVNEDAVGEREQIVSANEDDEGEGLGVLEKGGDGEEGTATGKEVDESDEQFLKELESDYSTGQAKADGRKGVDGDGGVEAAGDDSRGSDSGEEKLREEGGEAQKTAGRGGGSGGGPSQLSKPQLQQRGKYTSLTSTARESEAEERENEGKESEGEAVPGATSLLFSEQQQERLRRLSRHDRHLLSLKDRRGSETSTFLHAADADAGADVRSLKSAPLAPYAADAGAAVVLSREGEGGDCEGQRCRGGMNVLLTSVGGAHPPSQSHDAGWSTLGRSGRRGLRVLREIEVAAAGNEKGWIAVRGSAEEGGEDGRGAQGSSNGALQGSSSGDSSGSGESERGRVLSSAEQWSEHRDAIMALRCQQLWLAELFSLSFAIGLRHVYPSTEMLFIQAQAAGTAQVATAEAQKQADLKSGAANQLSQQSEESGANAQKAGGEVVEGGRGGRVLEGVGGGGVEKGVKDEEENATRLQELIQKELEQLQQQTGIKDLLGGTGRQGAMAGRGAGEAAAAVSSSGSGATNGLAQAQSQFLRAVQGARVAATVSRLQRLRVKRDDWLAKGVADIDESANATFASRSSLLINKFTPGVSAVAQKFLTGSPLGRQLFVDEDLKLVYCSVPKVACTSWKMWLRTFHGLPHANDMEWTHIDKVNGLSQVAYAFRESDALRALSRSDLFRFVFVRDPFARIASTYIEKHVRAGIKRGKAKLVGDMLMKDWVPGQGREPTRVIQERRRWNDLLFEWSWRQLANETTYLLSFSQFLQLVESSISNPFLDPHIQKQSVLCGLHKVRYHFIGHLESLQSDAQHVLSHLGDLPSFGLFNPRTSDKQGSANQTSGSGSGAGVSFGMEHSTGASGRLLELYDKESYERVKRIYASDFDAPLNHIHLSIPPVLRERFEEGDSL